MKLVERSPATFQVQLIREEMLAINNALNEVLHGIEVPDFHARLGVSRDFARTLLDSLGRLLDGEENDN